MQPAESQASLRQDFYKSIQAAQNRLPTGMPSDIKVERPNFTPEDILADNDRGDMVDVGVCQLLFDFLVQLHRRFPQRARLTKVISKYWKLCQCDLKRPVLVVKDMYDECVKVKKDVFHRRTDENEQIVVAQLAKTDYFKLFGIESMWCPRLEDRTREAIWSHVTRIVKIVSIVSKFSDDSRKKLNTLAGENMSKDQRSQMSSGEFDIAEMLTSIQEKVLENDEMLDSIVDVAEQEEQEMRGQGMSEEQLQQNPFE